MIDEGGPRDDEATVLVEDRPGRVRRCVASRERLDPRTMLRFVVGPDDRLVFDVDGRLPGRGLWLSANHEAVKKAVARNAFARAAGQRVVLPADLAERLLRQLHDRCLQWLGLARRAGAIEMGFEQVERATATGDLALLVVACDAGDDGVTKLARRGLPMVRGFTSREMGEALGRPPLVYAGLRPGRLAEGLLVDARKLDGLGGIGTGRANLAAGGVAPTAPAGDDERGAGTGPRQHG